MAPRRRSARSAPSLLELEAASQLRSGGRRGARSAARGGRRDPGLIWLTRLGSVVALAACVLFLNMLQRDVEAGQYGLIEADRCHLDRGPGWFDPRWEGELARSVAALGSLDPDDRASIEAVAQRVGELSFVREVGRPAVIWPDGLRLDLRLREPIACVVAPPGRQFATLAGDGTVLSGRWSAPPDRASGYLPLLWPSESLYPEPGQVLEDPAIVDGLAVAAALWRELPATSLARLGRVVVDARRSRQTSPDEPGTRILLEDGREVVFGRSPNLDAPGETPVHLKLLSLTKALEPEITPWVLVDVRWDRPEILVAGQAEPDPELEPYFGYGADARGLPAEPDGR